MALEQPEYEVEATYPGFELRRYQDFCTAECTIQDAPSLRDASSLAFGRLFGFISGRNSGQVKIAMTTPVRQVPFATGWKISFVVPKSVVQAGIPNPQDSSISITKVRGGLYAAHRYRGVWNSSTYESKCRLLLDAVEAQGYQTIGEVIGAVYNPPLTPPPLRRNEVMVAITER